MSIDKKHTQFQQLSRSVGDIVNSYKRVKEVQRRLNLLNLKNDASKAQKHKKDKKHSHDFDSISDSRFENFDTNEPEQTAGSNEANTTPSEKYTIETHTHLGTSHNFDNTAISRPKSKGSAFLLWLFLGHIGAHRIYTEKTKSALLLYIGPLTIALIASLSIFLFDIFLFDVIINPFFQIPRTISSELYSRIIGGVFHGFDNLFKILPFDLWSFNNFNEFSREGFFLNFRLIHRPTFALIILYFGIMLYLFILRIVDLCLLSSQITHYNRTRFGTAPVVLKTPAITFLFLTTLGVFGGHRFYLKKYVSGVLYALTFGFWGIGVLIDLFFFHAATLKINHEEFGDEAPPILKSQSTAYLFLTILGYLGGHRFYLKKYLSAVLYLLTFGFFGIGVILDAFLLPNFVKKYNSN